MSMNLCTHKTHPNWADTLKKIRPEDNDIVAFWKTTNTAFSAISKGEILFFNVEGLIMGGGTFIEFIPSSTIAKLWNEYGFFAGAKSLKELENDIEGKSGGKLVSGVNTNISYIKLDNIFWFSDGVAKAFTKEFNVQKGVQNPVKKYTIEIYENK